jgi:allophanate hydrolase subunit 2
VADNAILINGVQPTVTTAVDSYTSPINGGGTRITAFTASNKAGNTTETYRVFIGAGATDAKEIIPVTSVAGSQKDSPFELIGHIIPAGEKLLVQVSTGTTIAFRSTGIEF